MAASGVLSSWLMLATNCDLCWLAISSSRLFWAISSNRRAFSSAMADWSAKVCMRLTTASGNSPGCRRCRTSAPSGPSPPSSGTMSAARRPASIAASRRGLLGRLVMSGTCSGWRLAIASPRPVSPAEMSSLRNLATTSSSSPVVSPSSKPTDLLAIVEDRAAIGAGEIDRAVDDGLQHDLEIERRTDRAADLAQGGEVAVARLHLLEQPRVLDGDDGLIGESLEQLDLLVA